MRLDDTFFPDTASDGPPTGGLFCISPDTPTTMFFSWRPDPLAEAMDAFTQDWSQFQGYANPLWCLILRTLSKIQREEARVLLIAPVWRTQPWYPLLLKLLVKIPHLLPKGKEMVVSPTQKDFIMPTGVPQLAAWPSSGKNAGLSEGASDLLSASWRGKTTTSYESLFKRWDSWCKKRDRDPTRGPVVDVANFLAQLFLQYRSLNAYRSAIGSVYKKIDGVEVGKHPLIARVLKGVFNKRPPRPKYNSVWDVNQVLAWLKLIGPSESLSLQDLTIKTTMLLALTRPCRGANLAALDLTNRKYIPEGVVFSPSHLSKQSRSSHHGIEFF